MKEFLKSIYCDNHTKKKFTQLVFLSIFILLSIQTIFNSFCTELSLHYPYTTFLFQPDEKFADFFKSILSLPENQNVLKPNTFFPNFLQVPEYITKYLINNPYGGEDVLSNTDLLSHFMNPPITTSIYLVSLKIFKFVPAQIFFLIMCSFFYWAVFNSIFKATDSKNDAYLWSLTFLLSYPALMIFSRGNIGAMIAFFSAFYFLLNLPKDAINNKFTWLLFILAIGVNARPNIAILSLIPLIHMDRKFIIKYLAYFSFFCVSIFLVFLALTNYLYPAFTIHNWLLGLESYHSNYVVKNWGISFGSSFFTVLKMFFGYNKPIEIINYLIFGAVIFYTCYLGRNRKISKLAFIYIIAGSSIIGSPVIGDYHLSLFFAVLMYCYVNNFVNMKKTEVQTIVLAIIILISPKNYIYIHENSLQVIINPLVFMTSIFYLLKLKITIPKLDKLNVR